MEDIKEAQDETIETLLTEDYNDKKSKKKQLKQAKKQQKKEKKEKEKEKRKIRKNRTLSEEETKAYKKRKKRLIINYSVIMLLLLILIVFVLVFIPKIKLVGDKIVKVEYGEHYEDKGCIATYQGKDISDKIWYEGVVDESTIGKYKIVCKIRKNKFVVSKERTVEIVDTTKPVIELVGEDKKTICPKSEYQEEGFTAKDNYDGDITNSVKREEKDGEVIYSVSDSSGNSEEVKRTIIKEDKTPPEISLNGNETVYVTVGNKYNDQGAKAIDNCDEDLSSSIKVEGSVDTNNVGTYTITYSVADLSGNTSSKERKVNVQKAAQKLSSSLGCGSAGTIYLTFDDGPNDNYTPTILNVLKKYGVKATFFITGSGSDSLVAREHNEGHAIGVHTWTHNYGQIYASSEAFWSDFNRVQDRIKRITGSETKIMRFPGGASNTVSKIGMSVIANEAISKGYNYIDWNVSSGDSGGTTDPNQECRNVTSSLSKSRGNVVLMHDIKKHTMNAIECIVKYGVDNGYSFAALDSNVICRHATKK